MSGAIFFDSEPYILYNSERKEPGADIEYTLGNSLPVKANIKCTYDTITSLGITLRLMRGTVELCKKYISISCCKSVVGTCPVTPVNLYDCSTLFYGGIRLELWVGYADSGELIDTKEWTLIEILTPPPPPDLTTQLFRVFRPDIWVQENATVTVPVGTTSKTCKTPSGGICEITDLVSGQRYYATASHEDYENSDAVQFTCCRDETYVSLFLKEKLADVGFFRSIGDWFFNFDSIPLLDYPLRWLATPFYTADDWMIAINAHVETILSWTEIDEKIKATYDIITHGWSEVLALIPTWEDIKPTWFPISLEAFKKLILDTVPGLPDWFPTTLEGFKTLITNTWGSVTNSATDLVNWITTPLKAKFNILDHSWQDVLDAIEAAKTKFPVTSLSDSIIIQNALSLSDAFASRTEGFKIVGWTEPPYTCFICGKTFNDDEDFITHMAKHLTTYEELNT